MVGILACGAYVPQRRLQRSAIQAATGWFAPGLKSLARGERAVAGWDEDVITMAVEAARDCISGRDRSTVARVLLASTTHPFADRQNAVVVKEALNLSDAVGTMDGGGGMRAGTTALLAALRGVAGGEGATLCIGAEKRATLPGSELELTSGDAAAALLVGEGEGVAEFISGQSLSVDFVDHFRAVESETDYHWEARWIREEGYGRIAVNAVRMALADAGVEPAAVARFVMGSPVAGAAALVARGAGIADSAVADTLAARLGDAGSAQPLLLLAHALAQAKPGEIIVLAGFGQGCDVLLFRATAQVAGAAPGLGVDGWLARRREDHNYFRHLAFTGALRLDKGMRAEFDQKVPLTHLYRNRRGVLGLVGGKCRETGTVQFPKSAIGVAQNARPVDTQDDYPLAELAARIVTHTADGLTFSPDPPQYYGAVEFQGGGRMTVEFADVETEDVYVGAPMRMMFRIKAFDEKRHFIKYFWKAVPDYLVPAQPLAVPAE